MSIPLWPAELLCPLESRAWLVPFTRSGGRTLGGVSPATRTDLGFWRVDLAGIPLHGVDRRRAWDAIDAMLSGAAGRIAVPAWSIDSAPYASGREEEPGALPHEDGAVFSDGARYSQGAISVLSYGVTGVGATVISLRLVHGAADLSGVRFSYRHALYKTGQVLSVDGDIWTVLVTPSIRETIPAGADLEFDRPTCLCRLAEDTGLRRSITAERFERTNASFVEDTDYWYLLAKGLV